MKRWANGHGGHFVQFGRWFKAQKSGYGHWCELMIGVRPDGRTGWFEWWGDPRSGKTIHWLVRT